MSGTALGIYYEEAYCGSIGNFFNYRCLDLVNPGLVFWLISVVLVIISVVLVYLIIRIWRTKTLSTVIKVLATFTIVLAIFSFLYVELWNLEHTSYGKVSIVWENFTTKSQTNQVNMPDYAIEAANSLIINRIGEDRFNNDIIYNEAETKKTNVAKVLGNATHQVYKIAYNFKPLEILNGSSEDSLFYVDIVDKESPYHNEHIGSRQGIVNDHLPDCVRDASFCDFDLTTNDAIKVANENGFITPDLRVKWHSWGYPQLTIELSSCSKNKVMHLDYRDSSVIDFKDEVICGGVF